MSGLDPKERETVILHDYYGRRILVSSTERSVWRVCDKLGMEVVRHSPSYREYVGKMAHRRFGTTLRSSLGAEVQKRAPAGISEAQAADKDAA